MQGRPRLQAPKMLNTHRVLSLQAKSDKPRYMPGLLTPMPRQEIQAPGTQKESHVATSTYPQIEKDRSTGGASDTLCLTTRSDTKPRKRWNLHVRGMRSQHSSNDTSCTSSRTEEARAPRHDKRMAAERGCVGVPLPRKGESNSRTPPPSDVPQACHIQDNKSSRSPSHESVSTASIRYGIV